MKMTNEEYRAYAEKHMPRSHSRRDALRAFAVGGGICALGQLITELYLYLGLEKDPAGAACSVTLIFIAVVLTAVGVFDKIAKHAGAGTLVPITGFANSVVSPAIDSKSEGFILGVGAKIFTVAGPVLLYGTLAGAIYGVILWIFGLV